MDITLKKLFSIEIRTPNTYKYYGIHECDKK